MSLFVSLLSEGMTDCTFMNKAIQDDGYGGYTTTWTDGATFKAAIVLNSSLEARIAEAQGVKNVYTITTSKAITLKQNDVIKRNEDEKIFRITSDGTDNKTPNSAGLDMRNVSAEEWNLI